MQKILDGETHKHLLDIGEISWKASHSQQFRRWKEMTIRLGVFTQEELDIIFFIKEVPVGALK